MPLPGNLTTREVKGQYINLVGAYMTGQVEFTVSSILTNPGADVVIIPTPVIAELDAEGRFSVMLVTTDDIDLSPTGFRYKVVEKFNGAVGRTFYLDVPGDSAVPIDTADIVTTQPPSGGSTAYATLAALQAEEAARILGDLNASTLDWISVKAHGALGNNVADDTAEIQAALDACPEGGTVYFPVGKYRTSAPLVIPPYVTIQGPHGNGEQLPTDTAPACSIKPLASFAGDAVLRIDDKETAGYAVESREQRIYNLSIDGSDLGATVVDGIKAYGYVQALELRDVCIWRVTGNGFISLVNPDVLTGSQAPLAMKFDRVLVYESGASGFIMFNATDSTFVDAVALGCGTEGWYVEGAANSTLIGCRAEWSETDGFKIQPKFGPVELIGCSTDRNSQNGISVVGGDWDSSVLISAPRLNRDGRNGGAGGGAYSGLRVDTNCPVFVDGIMVTVRQDDTSGAGPKSPDYGITVLNSQSLIVASGFLNAMVGGLRDLGGNSNVLRGANVEEKIGNLIGAAGIVKRGIRATLTDLKWHDSTGKEYDLLGPNTPVATDQGLLAWSGDLGNITGSVAPSSGVIQLIRVKLRAPATTSKVALNVQTAGSGLTAGQNLVGIYDAAGTLLGQSADQSTAWASTGLQEIALTAPLVMAAGEYYVALLSVGTTPPSLSRLGTGAAGLMNVGTATTARRFATYTSGHTSFPATLTLGSMTRSFTAYAVALMA